MKLSKQQLAKLTKEEKLKLLDAIEEKRRRKKEARKAFSPHAGQLDIVNSKAKIRVVTAANGCWAPGTLVRMFDGSVKPVEQVQLGDKLMGPDSKPRTVLKLFSGREEMYKITPKRSEPYVVNKSHMLSIYRWAKMPRDSYKSHLIYEEVSVADFLTWGPEKRRTSYQWRPMRGVEFQQPASELPLPLDPYILGTWLGDGTSAELAITSMDEEIVNAWKEYFDGYKCSVHTQKGNRAATYKFTQNIRSPNIGSHGRKALLDLGVLNNKHIPAAYKLASRQDRLQLLAGLLDTDGHLHAQTLFELTSVSERLLDDARELANSLGFSTSKRVKYVKGKPYYRMHIVGEVSLIPCRLARKQADPNYVKQRPESWREPFTTEPAGEGEFYGFMVDSDNLLLLADYTVQRNSGKTALGVNETLWALDGYNPVTDTHTPVPANVIVVLDSPDKVADVWLPEIRKWRVLRDEQLHKRGKPYYTEITWDNGSRLRFMFMEQQDLAFESISGIDFCCIDEPPPRSVWVALLRGGREKKRNSRYLLIATPISQQWIRTYYVDWQKGMHPDTEFFIMSTHANKDNLAEGYIEQFSAHLTEAEKRTRLHGEFFNNEGMALAGLWKRDRHLIPASQLPDDYKQSWPHVVAADPHPSKPTTMCLVAAAPDGKKYYVDEFSKKMIPREIARWLKANWLASHRVVDLICDNYGSGDYTGGEGFKSFIEVMRLEGVRMRPTSYDEKKDEEFLERIQEALYIPQDGEPQLQVLLNLPGIVRDIENVQWKRIKGTEMYQPKLEIGNTDFLACLKYALASGLTFDNARRKVIRPARPPAHRSDSKKFGFTPKPGYLERARARQRDEDEDEDDW